MFTVHRLSAFAYVQIHKRHTGHFCVYICRKHSQSLCSHAPFYIWRSYAYTIWTISPTYTASVFIHTVNDDRNAALKINVTHWKEFLWEELHTCFHGNVFLESLILKNSSTLETSASNVILFTQHGDILKQMFD